MTLRIHSMDISLLDPVLCDSLSAGTHYLDNSFHCTIWDKVHIYIEQTNITKPVQVKVIKKHKCTLVTFYMTM